MPREAPRLAFPIDEYQGRVAKTRAWMADNDLEVLVLTQPEHYNWLSGYDPTSIFYFQALVIALDEAMPPTLLCNQAERRLCAETCWLDDIEWVWTYEDQIARLVDLLSERGLAGKPRIGMNLSSYNLKPIYVRELEAALPEIELVDVSPALDELRLVKSELEIDYLRQAAHIADLGITAGINAARQHATDREVMAEIQRAVSLNGGEFPAYPGLVDARATLHGTAIGKSLADGDVVLMEVTGVARRYHCNIVRSIAVGSADDEVRRLYGIVEETHRGALELLRPGTTSEDIVDFSQRGLGEYAEENWGRFGFGMEISYPPIWIGALSLMKTDRHVLEPGIVLTLETGIMADVGALLLGTNVLVTEHGPEVLNNVPMSLIVR